VGDSSTSHCRYVYAKLKPCFVIGNVRMCSPVVVKADRFTQLLRLERGHINREAILHSGFEQSFVGFDDLLNGDDFDIGGNVMPAAKVEHLLGFGDTANGRAGEIATLRHVITHQKLLISQASGDQRWPSTRIPAKSGSRSTTRKTSASSSTVSETGFAITSLSFNFGLRANLIRAPAPRLRRNAAARRA
jgi:hypothetical protein